MVRTILMIDDDYQLAQELKTHLPERETELIHAFRIQDAARTVSRKQLSTVILNLSLPGIISPFDFLRDLRLARPMPILALGGLTAAQRARAYRLGADLCMNKPVDSEELAEAVRALLLRYYRLNRLAQLQEVDMAIHHRELVLIPQWRKVTMRGMPVALSAKEFNILHFLASNPGIVFTKEQIYERIWKEDYPYGSRSVTDHISSIPQKLGLDTSDQDYIETVHGVGYRFVPYNVEFCSLLR